MPISIQSKAVTAIACSGPAHRKCKNIVTLKEKRQCFLRTTWTQNQLRTQYRNNLLWTSQKPTQKRSQWALNLLMQKSKHPPPMKLFQNTTEQASGTSREHLTRPAASEGRSQFCPPHAWAQGSPKPPPLGSPVPHKSLPCTLVIT